MVPNEPTLTLCTSYPQRRNPIMLFLLMAPTSFMAGPALTSVRKTAVPMAAGPQMMLGMGGAGRALGRMGRATRSIMKVPGSGNKDSGSGFGCGNDGGGTSGDATPAGEDGGDNPFVVRACRPQRRACPVRVRTPPTHLSHRPAPSHRWRGRRTTRSSRPTP